jgi:hypothetical protein
MIGTSVPIIAVLDSIDTAATRGAGIYSTGITIVARNGCVYACSLVARIRGTQILIIARNGSEIAKSLATGIDCAEIVVVTHDWCVFAVSGVTGVGSTVIVIVTVYGREDTRSTVRVTGIVGTQIVVIAIYRCTLTPIDDITCGSIARLIRTLFFSKNATAGGNAGIRGTSILVVTSYLCINTQTVGLIA